MKTLAFFFVVSAQAALFGADDRVAMTPSSPHREQARATAVAVLSSLIGPSEKKLGTYKLDADSLSGFLCEDERFSKDPSLSYACSGFLVAPDLLVTAGHCMVNTGESRHDTDKYCAAYGWLFDYQASAEGHVALDGIPAENYVKCKEVIYAVRDERAPFRDFALVRLEHPVAGRKPFPMAAVAKGDSLSMIGYPFGSPQKLSWHGRVKLDDPQRPSFLTTLDAFEGNSGSVVFNARGEAVGILVAGTPSANTVKDIGKQCDRYNRCDENGENCVAPDNDTSLFPGYQGVGSEVQRIDAIQDLLKTL